MDNDIEKMRTNPEAFKKLLCNVATQIFNKDFTINIPKTQDLDDIWPLKSTISQTKKYMQERYLEIVEDRITDVLESLKIQDKCLQLAKLGEAAGSGTAWRPTTGEIPLTPILAKHLQVYKLNLQKKLKCHKKDVEDLEKVIMSHQSSCKRSVEDMDTIVENATNLNSQINKVISYKED